MTTELHFGKDDQGFNAFAPLPSTTIFSATLVNGSAQSITIPASAIQWTVAISIQPGNNVFVDFTGATAAAPAGSSFASTTSVLNPGARTLATFKNDGVTQNTISFLTTNASTDITVEFYTQPR